MNRLRHILYIIGVILSLAMMQSCIDIDDNKIPSYPVNINLSTAGYWQTYGVTAPGMYREFNIDERKPANYPYVASSRTGFGGVLLVSDIFSGDPMAYDMSCPVERRADVRIYIDESNYEAVCPKCGSRYDVMAGWGSPLYGRALSMKVGLSRYSVVKFGAGYNIVN